MTNGVRDLIRALRSECITPDDDDYALARKLYNGDIDRFPSVIVQPESVESAITAIRVLAECGASYTVRGGGHNVAGRAVRDRLPMLDLRRLTRVRVLLEEKVVRVAGGATWHDVDTATEPVGLVVPGGIVPSTGVGGLTLGGGVGWLLPAYGLTSDNLIGAVVAATDGRLWTCSLEENADLLRALRGGGYGLGVVLEFVFAARRLASITGGWLRFGPETMTAALETTIEAMSELSPTTMVTPALLWQDGRPCCEVDLVAMGDDRGDIDRLTSRLARLRPIETEISERTYGFVQSMTDNPRRKGMPSYWRSALRKSSPAGVAQAIVELFLGAPT